MRSASSFKAQQPDGHPEGQPANVVGHLVRAGRRAVSQAGGGVQGVGAAPSTCRPGPRPCLRPCPRPEREAVRVALPAQQAPWGKGSGTLVTWNRGFLCPSGGPRLSFVSGFEAWGAGCVNAPSAALWRHGDETRARDWRGAAQPGCSTRGSYSQVLSPPPDVRAPSSLKTRRPALLSQWLLGRALPAVREMDPGCQPVAHLGGRPPARRGLQGQGSLGVPGSRCSCCSR